MDIVLIAGLWLDGSAWDGVVPALEALGHRPVPLTLPGQGDGSGSATLDDQVAAVLAAVDASSGKPMVVGHSAASILAWLAADARPEKVAKVALVGGFPSADGELYADLFEPKDGVMPFPGWGPFEGPDSADLDEEAKCSIASASAYAGLPHQRQMRSLARVVRVDGCFACLADPAACRPRRPGSLLFARGTRQRAWPAGEMDSRSAVLRSGCRAGLRHDFPRRGRHPGRVPPVAPSCQFACSRATRPGPGRELRRDRDAGPGRRRRPGARR